MSPPPQDISKMQTCVLKVNIHCQGCKRKVQKILNKVQGVYGVEVDAERGRATVTGVATPEMLINKLAMSKKPAELLDPAKGGQLKSILLPSSDNGQLNQNVKTTKVIHPGDDTNKVPIPKGMKVVKEVKVLADDLDDNELKATDEFTFLGAKDKDIIVTDADGVRPAKGGGGVGGVGKSGKMGSQQDHEKGGHIENTKRSSRLEAVLKNKLTNRKAADSRGDTGGEIGGFSAGREAMGAKTVQMDQMGRTPHTHVPLSNDGYYQADVPYDHQPQRVVINQQPHSMTNNNDMYHHQMRYSQADSSGRVPLPPPPAADPLAHIFNDENANGCSIM